MESWNLRIGEAIFSEIDLAVDEVVTLAGPSSWILRTFLLRAEAIWINLITRKILMVLFRRNCLSLFIGGFAFFFDPLVDLYNTSKFDCFITRQPKFVIGQLRIRLKISWGVNKLVVVFVSRVGRINIILNIRSSLTNNRINFGLFSLVHPNCWKRKANKYDTKDEFTEEARSFAAFSSLRNWTLIHLILRVLALRLVDLIMSSSAHHTRTLHLLRHLSLRILHGLMRGLMLLL